MTQIAKHTPGPWEIAATVNSNVLNIFGVSKNQEYHVGTFTAGTAKDLPVFKANARLIAAAPEILEALALCVDCLSELARLDDGTPSISALDMARAAIAKTSA